MAITNPFKKLEKLTIVGYENGADGNFSGAKETYKVMYNPEKLSIQFGQKVVDKPAAGNNQTPPVQTLRLDNGSFSVELFLDGTGASLSGGIANSVTGVVSALTTSVVKNQVAAFFKTTTKPVDKTHEPRYLKIFWGDGFAFACKMESASVNYLLFERNGNPLRAIISASFKQAPCNNLSEDGFNSSGLGFQSPDLTKLHTVVAGDTIYNIAKKEYDSESYYLQIAEANDLKNYRKLIPGQKLILPPVKTNS